MNIDTNLMFEYPYIVIFFNVRNCGIVFHSCGVRNIMSKYTQTLSESDMAFELSQQQRNSAPQAGTQLLNNHQIHSHEVLLLIEDKIERLMITAGLEYQLGRFESPDSYQVSLNQYRPMERGISRLHASLFVRDNKLYIIDHGSTNGTYVAGERLRPDTPVILSKGADILLGRLRVQVIFQ